MGWSNWFSDNGDKVTEKHSTTKSGESKVEFLRAKGGDKSNHSHVGVTTRSDGRKVCNAAPYKHDRKK